MGVLNYSLVETLWVMGSHNASKHLDVVHCLAAHICQAYACTHKLTLSILMITCSVPPSGFSRTLEQASSCQLRNSELC